MMNTKNTNSINYLTENGFIEEYELRLKLLKELFLEQVDWQKYCLENSIDELVAHIELEKKKQVYSLQLDELCNFVRNNFWHFNANNVSSIIGIPSLPLDADELVFHRIWIGSKFPNTMVEAIRQWDSAAEVVKADLNMVYANIIWVWDIAQIKDDPLFIQDVEGDKYFLGFYQIGDNRSIVKSLSELVAEIKEVDYSFMLKLKENRYFVDLSDYFRELILYRFGGIYLDADTMPYRTATVFMAKPEVPNYYFYKYSDEDKEIEKIHVSWLNLMYDENGMQIAKKDNRTLAEIVDRMNKTLAKLDKNIPDVNDKIKYHDYQLVLHDATYGEWQKNIGRTFLSYVDVIAKLYLVVVPKVPETVLLGLYGMRIIYDPVNNQKLPLNEYEQICYKNCIERLEARNWSLEHPLQLQSYAPVTFAEELMRIAYSPQLRTFIHEYDYYSFMSLDKNLDKVNNLFGSFMLAVNAESIKHPNYWVRMNGHVSKYYLDNPYKLPILEQMEKPQLSSELQNYILPKNIRYIKGNSIPESHKDHIAELLFETSYLEYCSFGNKLNLPKVQLQRIQNVDPLINYCNVMINFTGSLLGFFIGLKMSDLNNISFTSYYRDEMKEMDDQYDKFIANNTIENDYFVSSLAIDKKYRNQGYFKTMFDEIVKSARQRQCGRIMLTVWESNKAMDLYLKKGFRVVDTFDYAYNVFYDKLHMLEYTAH